MIASNITELIGHTPLLELNALRKKLGLKARIIAKLESFNPAGSVKDRVGLSLINDAERTGRLKPGGTIVEPTSGNTGIALAYIGTCRGYRVILTMPETMSLERRKLISALGAEIVLTPGQDGMVGAIQKANQLVAQIDGAILAAQFDNPANPAAHIATAREILNDIGEFDYFVATVGTGGTLTGAARELRTKLPSLKVIAVEPAESAVLSGAKSGVHGIQGIGAGFIPKVLDTEIYNEILPVATSDAKKLSRMLAGTEGFLAGISSGAAVAAAIVLAMREENAGKTIVVILPDTGERYLSTDTFEQ